MNKAMLITLTTIAVLGIVSQSAFFVKTAEAFMGSAASNQRAMLAQLPSDLVIPQDLPSGIQDPILLEAWVRLYNHQETIQLWDGNSVTGQGLAHFLLDHAITVMWDIEQRCEGGSCSVQYCHDDTCTYEDGTAGVDPIFITPAERGDMDGLVRTLAHEIFHRTRPFGDVKITRFEEYWAFWIGAKISKSVTPTFDGYDPLVSGHLYLWLLKNRMSAYYTLPEYPVSVVALVQSHI